MKACGCSNEKIDFGKGMDLGCEADFDIDNMMKEEFSSSYGMMGSNEGGANGLMAMPMGNGSMQMTMGNGSMGNGSGMIGLPGCGRVRNFNRSANVQGRNYQIVNRNYYNNYYSRYNHYFVTDLNINRSFVKDYNVYHYYTRTVNEGCRYLGSSTIIANGGNSGWGSGCGFSGNMGCGCY